jgi:hypothetical protein
VGDIDVYNNRYYGNEASKILYCASGATVYNNFILDNIGDWIVNTGGSCNFVNNTVASNDVNAPSGSNNAAVVMKDNANYVANNLIAFNTGTDSILHFAADTSTFEYNALYSNSKDPATLTNSNLVCDPKFSTSGGSDVDSHKLGAGSACIDKGKNLASVVKDYFGTTRPLDGDGDGTAVQDPGAYEAAVPTIGKPEVTGLGVSPATFSPNADGTADTTTLSFNLNVNASVTVAVLNASSVEMKRLADNQSMTSGSQLIVWDGKDKNGTVVADDTYSIKVTAKNAAGTDEKEVSVVVNTGTPPPPAEYCAGFTDLPKDYPKCDAVTYVKSIGAMTGNPDGTFDPNSYLQRDQVAKVSLMAFNLFSSSMDYCNSNNPFPDVTSSAWSFQYVCRGVDLNMITGYKSGDDAGYYRPARSVNRVEFLALALRNLSDAMPDTSSTSYNDVEAGQWYSGYAKYSYDNSLFTGNSLYPTRFTTRIEVAEVLYKLHSLGKL